MLQKKKCEILYSFRDNLVFLMVLLYDNRVPQKCCACCAVPGKRGPKLHLSTAINVITISDIYSEAIAPSKDHCFYHILLYIF